MRCFDLPRVRVMSCSLLLLISFAAPASAANGETARTAGATEFAAEIEAFERSDRAAPPPRGAVLFVGSSSIRMWKTLARDMAPLTTINRGFGGSQLAHVDYYADRIVLPYAPRAIVLYAGDNDLSAGSSKTPERVLDDLKLFVSRIHASLPDTPVYFLAIKPSPARFAQWPAMERANALAREFAKETSHVEYVDIATPMLRAGTPPDKALFVGDELHLSARGYALWTAVLKPVLLAEMPEPAPPADP